MDTFQFDDTPENRGFVKAAIQNGMSPLQAIAFCKLASTPTATPGLNPDALQQAAQVPQLQDYAHDQWLNSGKAAFKGTPVEKMWQSGSDAFNTIAMGTGGASLLYLLSQNAKKREREEKSQYPMRVAYGQ